MSEAQQINIELRELYLNYWRKLKISIAVLSPEIQRELSCPLLPHIYKDYFAMNKKIVFVGKETHGWNKLTDYLSCNDEDAIDIIKSWYLEFDFGKDINQGKGSFNSAFWRFCHQIYGGINKIPDNELWRHSRGFVWLNMSRIDESKQTPSKIVLDKTFALSAKLLADEISVLKPDIVVFIGYDYWKRFKKLYDFEAHFLGNDNFSNSLYRIKSSVFFENSVVYWSRHPERKNLAELDFVINSIVSQQNP